MPDLSVTYWWAPLPTRAVTATPATTVIARSHEAMRYPPGHLHVTVPVISIDQMSPEEQAAFFATGEL
jgi:hypothetical protein